VVDAAHGAAYQIAPKVFHELGAEVVAIGCSPDGLNINHEVGATHPEALVDAVKAHKADYGIALDGDADRLQMVDAQGRLYNGDELLYLMADDRLGRDEHVPGVVGTLMTNMAVEVALKARGVQFVRAKVGDRYVLEELEKHRWILGGEGSGHLLALDKHTTGDGLISRAAGAAGLCAQWSQSLAQLLAELTLFPQTLINVRLRPDQDWKSNTRLEAETRSGAGRAGRLRPGADPRQRHRAAVAADGRGPRPAPGAGLRRAAGPDPAGLMGPAQGSVAMSDLSVIRADYANPVHARALVSLLDAYARDPAGGGHALDTFARDNLVRCLAALPQAFSVLAFDGDTPVGLVNCIEGFSTFACRPLVNVHDLAVRAQPSGSPGRRADAAAGRADCPRTQGLQADTRGAVGQ
jgi:hypothetical protein